jgi:probable F420-dependent oxidoreductase
MSDIGVKLQGTVPVVVNVSLANYAEIRGLRSVWVDEVRSRDALASMAVLAAATERVTIGSSIIPIYTRTAPVLAMAAATLNELAPGRIVIGLGTSSRQIIEEWHGCSRSSPVQAMTEYLSAVRSALRGDRVVVQGDVVHVNGFRLEPKSLASGSVPLYAAALGPDMATSAARLADGILLNMVPVSAVAGLRAMAHAASRDPGAGPGPARLVSDLRVGIAEDEVTRHIMRERQRKYIAHYGNVAPYRRHFERIGFAEAAQKMQAAWLAGDRDGAVKAVPDEMVDELVAIGSPQDVAGRICSLFAAGIDELILWPCTTVDEEVPSATQAVIELAAEFADGANSMAR